MISLKETVEFAVGRYTMLRGKVEQDQVKVVNEIIKRNYFNRS